MHCLAETETAARNPEYADLKDISVANRTLALAFGSARLAEDALARLDERLRSSQITERFISGSNFQDA